MPGRNGMGGGMRAIAPAYGAKPGGGRKPGGGGIPGIIGRTGRCALGGGGAGRGGGGRLAFGLNCAGTVSGSADW